LGTKASVQVVVPFLTESYSSTQDPADPSVPICLLHNFPNVIEHTIQWARDNFAGLYTNPAQQADEYKRNPQEFVERTAKTPSHYDQNEITDNIKRSLGEERPKNFVDCIKWVSQLKIFFCTNENEPLLFFRLAIYSNNNFTIPSLNYCSTFPKML
jgi:ubiquitin-activating enzyme E1